MFQASLETSLGRRFQETLDIAAAGKMLADGAQHDDAHPFILVQRLEHEPQLVALRHRNDVERRAVEDHVGALARGIDLDAKAVERGEARVGESRTHRLRFLRCDLPCGVPLRLVLARQQLAAQELADRRFRDRLDEDVAARPLEIGEPRVAAELIELLRLDRRRGA